MTIINTELQRRLNELPEPNKIILEKLLIDIEQIPQREEVRALLRSRIREQVTLEMKR